MFFFSDYFLGEMLGNVRLAIFENYVLTILYHLGKLWNILGLSAPDKLANSLFWSQSQITVTKYFLHTNIYFLQLTDILLGVSMVLRFCS